jgi:hypothetical protein
MQQRDRKRVPNLLKNSFNMEPKVPKINNSVQADNEVRLKCLFYKLNSFYSFLIPEKYLIFQGYKVSFRRTKFLATFTSKSSSSSRIQILKGS